MSSHAAGRFCKKELLQADTKPRREASPCRDSFRNNDRLAGHYPLHIILQLPSHCQANDGQFKRFINTDTIEPENFLMHSFFFFVKT